jgi:transcriptional regulator with GAF, ATPase, and Fis domain
VKDRDARLRSEVGLLRRDLARRDRFTEIIGTSAAMAEVFRLMESAAASPISVLIEGETGTGKELVARGIHRASTRADQPFVAVNCAALPADLLESELFGHRRGSFTGATSDYRGLFDSAHRGTIFLDEIGELPLAMQVKLLRVLQDGEITPVGSTRPRKVDIRVLSATNRDLRASVGQGTFREDLYYRLAAFPIRVPPLRERDGDVTLLADHFLTAAAQRHAKRIVGIDAEAFRLLEGYGWPGNVRQLENEIERASALAVDGGIIDRSLLSIGEAGAAEAPTGPAAVVGSVVVGGDGELAPLRQARAAFEADYIREALARNSGNVSHTARALGLSRVMLQKKMKDYGLRTA